MADVWANSMAYHPRATFHIAGSCQWANSVACHPIATYQIAGCCHFGEFTVMIPQTHATLQDAVSWRNQCHDRATLQGIRIHSALLSRRSQKRERLSASMLSICSSVCLYVRLSVAKMQKTRFSQKISNLELWSLLTTYRKPYVGFSKTPKIQDG